MGAFRRPSAIPADVVRPTGIQPESEMDAARPPFLSPRARNARGTLLGAAAVAGALTLGTASLAAAVITSARRSRANRMRGKVVLITGSSRGLGLALAEEFGRRGARIVLTARDQDELERARALLLNLQARVDPENILVVPADLRKPEDAEYLIHRVTDVWGQIDVLVNNAGVITVGPIENQTVEDFHAVMESNFFSGVQTTLSVLPQMLSRKSGTIVNIASIGGKIAVPHLLSYTASKFAVVGFSQGLNAEMRGKGIHVLTVCPGLMRTGSHLNALFSGNAEREYRWFSLGASLPGASTTAHHAAQRIVRAVLARETEIAITPQAVLAARLANLSPEVTGMGMGIANRLLPKPANQSPRPVPGSQVRALEPAVAAGVGWSAARRYNEIEGKAQ